MAGKKSYVDDDLLMLPFDFDEPSVSDAVEVRPVTATPTVDVREIIRTDFLGRDASFVHQRKTGRLGWETVLPEGESFSSFVIDTSNEEAVLKKAYRIARETLSAMDIPCKVSIRINNTETNCTDFKNVYVSTNMFDDKRLTCGQKADIFTGIAIHEGCHLMYTDREANKDVSDRLLYGILNVVEDERIERLLGEDLPGYANFLKMTKYYLFDLYEQAVAEECISEKDYVRLFNAILHLIRYPAALSDKDIDDFADELMAVREILSDWPDSTAAALDRSRKIYDLFKKYLEEEARDDDGEGRKEESDEKGDEERRGGKGGDKNDGKKGSEGDDDEDDREKEGDESDGGKDAGSGDKEDDSEEEGDETGGKSGSGSGHDVDEREEESDKGDGKKTGDGKGRKPGKPLTDEEIKDILDKLAELCEELSRDGSKPGSDEDMSDFVKESPLAQELCEGSAEHGAGKKAYFLKPELNQEDTDPKENYLDSLSRVRRHIPAIKKILQSNACDLAYSDKGSLTGKLDTDKLAEAVQGSPSVYIRQCEVKANRIAVCVLLDESGSMGLGHMGRSRIQWAKDAAVLLNEGLKDIPNVDLFIYGHSADQNGRGSTDIYTYRDHKERGRYNLGYADARFENADGYAIREVAKRVRQQTGERCLFFVLSDGMPAASVYRYGNSGVTDTRKAVEEVSRNGFLPIQVAIAPEVDPEQMFKHWVTLTDLADLPRQLGAVIKKAVLKRTGRGGLAA